ncbi:MAG: hypothetical protein JWN88_725 [Frankiales bacterium]|jgi:hypothetical protein|nr:hypothetical protein [Frankiales bacterium]
MTTPGDATGKSAPDTSGDTTAADRAVPGGSADRLDSPGEGSGGLPSAGADGETGAREQLRKDLGERSPDAGTEEGDSLEQAAAIGETDDPQGGSIQSVGSRP